MCLRLLLIFCLPTIGVLAQERKEPTEAEKRGTAIGETVRAAVTAVVPVAEPILAVLEKFKKKPAVEDKKKLEEALEEQRKALVAAANTALANLSRSADEIDAIKDLGDKARIAERNLTVVRSNLLARLSDDVWKEVENRWKGAGRSIEAVVNFDTSKIYATDVQSKFKTLKNQSDEAMRLIEEQIQRRENHNALSLVSSLLDKMSELTEAPGVHLTSFATNLRQASKGIQLPSKNMPPGPPLPPPGPSPLGELLDRVTGMK